jgi:hypothetical protein
LISGVAVVVAISSPLDTLLVIIPDAIWGAKDSKI